MSAASEENEPLKPKSEMLIPDRISVSGERAKKQRAEELARIEGKAQADAEAKKVAERTARLKAARLAREAADKVAANMLGARATIRQRPGAPRKGKGK